MENEYEIKPDGSGGWRVSPVAGGCGTLVAAVIFIVVLALIFKSCAEQPHHSQSSSNASKDTQSTVSANRTDSINGVNSNKSDSENKPDVGYVWLTDLSPISKDGYIYSDSKSTRISNIDTELTHYIYAGTMYHGGYGKGGWIEYYLPNSEYKYLTGCLAIEKEFYDTKYSGSLIIYVDEREIYRIDEMIAGSVPIEFKLDISTAERLRIEHSGGAAFAVANLKLWTKAPN